MRLINAGKKNKTRDTVLKPLLKTSYKKSKMTDLKGMKINPLLDLRVK